MKFEQFAFLPWLPTLMNSFGRFLDMQLKLGQAFSFACLIEFGHLLPIESTGQLKECVALFRSAKKPFLDCISGLGGPRLLPLSFCQN